MRNAILSIVCLGLPCLCAYLGAGPQDSDVKVRFRLVDAQTKKAVPGIIRVVQADSGKPIPLPGLFSRLRGLPKSEAGGWHVVGLDSPAVMLPRGKVRVEALAGLETALVREELDLGKSGDVVTLQLPYLFRPEKLGLVAGNTHLHLRDLSLEEAAEYLRQIPAADGLKVMFISYLERFKDDASYITNRFPAGDLKQFDGTGLLFNNGEEHRHNFEGFGQGYGHVMLLNLKEFVKPASLGPGITGAGFDDGVLLPGIDNARKQGGTIVWCHNTSGYEATVHALAGRLDALNVFDGSRSGSFDDRYYRFLNVGLRLPISTGTDWFMYDFSRVYARMPLPVSIAGWLDAVKAGRSVASNGPLLALSVDGKQVGDVLNFDKSASVKVEASGIGRRNFERLQLVHNGKVIKTQPAEAKDAGFSARLTHELRLDEPGWLAVRIDTQNRDEFDRVLFAHSSPVYVDLAGKRTFDIDSARALQKQLEEARTAIRTRGKFSTPEAQAKVLALYNQAAQELLKLINQRGK